MPERPVLVTGHQTQLFTHPEVTGCPAGLGAISKGLLTGSSCLALILLAQRQDDNGCNFCPGNRIQIVIENINLASIVAGGSISR